MLIIIAIPLLAKVILYHFLSLIKGYFYTFSNFKPNNYLLSKACILEKRE